MTPDEQNQSSFLCTLDVSRRQRRYEQQLPKLRLSEQPNMSTIGLNVNEDCSRPLRAVGDHFVVPFSLSEQPNMSTIGLNVNEDCSRPLRAVGDHFVVPFSPLH